MLGSVSKAVLEDVLGNTLDAEFKLTYLVVALYGIRKTE